MIALEQARQHLESLGRFRLLVVYAHDSMPRQESLRRGGDGCENQSRRSCGSGIDTNYPPTGIWKQSRLRRADN